MLIFDFNLVDFFLIAVTRIASLSWWISIFCYKIFFEMNLMHAYNAIFASALYRWQARCLFHKKLII